MTKLKPDTIKAYNYVKVLKALKVSSAGMRWFNRELEQSYISFGSNNITMFGVELFVDCLNTEWHEKFGKLKLPPETLFYIMA